MGSIEWNRRHIAVSCGVDLDSYELRFRQIARSVPNFADPPYDGSMEVYAGLSGVPGCNEFLTVNRAKRN
jgi:hypothetical protein